MNIDFEASLQRASAYYASLDNTIEQHGRHGREGQVCQLLIDCLRGRDLLGGPIAWAKDRGLIVEVTTC